MDDAITVTLKIVAVRMWELGKTAASETLGSEAQAAQHQRELLGQLGGNLVSRSADGRTLIRSF